MVTRQLDLCKWCYEGVVGGFKAAWCQCRPPEFEGDIDGGIPHWHISTAEWIVCTLCGEHFGSRLEAPGGYLEVAITARIDDPCDCDPYSYAVRHNNGGNYHDSRIYGILLGAVKSDFNEYDAPEFIGVSELLVTYERRQEELERARERLERAKEWGEQNVKKALALSAEEKAEVLARVESAGMVPVDWVKEMWEEWEDD